MALISFSPCLLDTVNLMNQSRESTGPIEQSFSPPFGYEEGDNEVRFSFHVPGVKASDWHVAVEEGRLCISGTRRILSADGTTRKRARFSRTISLLGTVDVSSLHANFSNGSLVVTAFKKPHTESMPLVC
eukprot:scaffold978_cov164-Amphora_coffeaeformis.AAC.8